MKSSSTLSSHFLSLSFTLTYSLSLSFSLSLSLSFSLPLSLSILSLSVSLPLSLSISLLISLSVSLSLYLSVSLSLSLSLSLFLFSLSISLSHTGKVVSDFSECFSDLDEITARYIQPMNDYVQEIGESICIFIFITFYSSIPVISLCISSLFPCFFFCKCLSLSFSIIFNLLKPLSACPSFFPFFLPSLCICVLPSLPFLLTIFLFILTFHF